MRCGRLQAARPRLAQRRVNMYESRSHDTPGTDSHAWRWLLLATALLCISNGRWIVPAAAWWSPVFMLRFVRMRRAVVGILAGLVVTVCVASLTWRDLIPLHGPSY